MRDRLAVRGLGVVTALLLAAPAFQGCSPGASSAETTPTPPDASPTPTPPSAVHLTADTTWSGAYAMTDDVIVDPGVTLTVSSNATITAATGKTLQISGTLHVLGAAAGSATPTIFESTSPNTWGGISVLSGGVALLTNVELRRATTGFKAATGALLSKLIQVKFSANSQPMRISASTKVCRGRITDASGGSIVDGGTVTFVDTEFTGGNGADTLVYSGTAQLVFSHVHEGVSWGCLIHGGGAGTTATIDKSSFDNGSHYAFMLSTGSTVAVHTSIVDGSTIPYTDGVTGSTVSASNNFWGNAGGYQGTVPAGWTVTPFENSATNAGVVDAGPRAPSAGCEADASF